MPADQQDFERRGSGNDEYWTSPLWTEDDHKRAASLRDQHRKVRALRVQLRPAARLSELREAGHGTVEDLEEERALVWEALQAVRGEQCICWCEDSLCECVMCTFIMRIREWWSELL